MPRTPTPAEQQHLARLQAHLPAFLAERHLVLADLFSRLGRADADRVALHPDAFVATLDAWLSPQDLSGASPEDHRWTLVRVGYLVGEVLVQRARGTWGIDSTPDSATFSRFVIGGFPPPLDPDLSIDPMAVALAYLAEPPGRSLRKHLDDLLPKAG